MVRRLSSIEVPTTHFEGHTEFTLQDVPKLQYSLRLFVGNEKTKLQTKDNQTWTLAQRPYVLYSGTNTRPDSCAYIEVVLGRRRCAWRSK